MHDLIYIYEQVIEAIRKGIDPLISNYKLVLDLDIACAFNYTLDEIRAMYASADASVNPNIFLSNFPPVHYSIYHMKLDVFEFLLQHSADISTVEDREGRTLLDLLRTMYQSGKITKDELRRIYSIVNSLVEKDVVAKFYRQVFLYEVYSVLCSIKSEDIVVLSNVESENYRKIVADTISYFKIKVDLDVACALFFTLNEVTSIYKNSRMDGNVFFTGYPAALYAIALGRIDFLDFLLESCGADIDATRDKRGRNLIEFLEERRSDLSTDLLINVHKCVCAHLPYMKANLFERKILMSQFYTSVTAVDHEVKDISHRLPSDKISELTALIPPEVTAPHLEPDLAHLLGYSTEVVLEMVQRGADVLSVVTGFPILCRYMSEGNYEAVCRIIEVSGSSCNALFLCDKNLKLPLSYVKKKGRNLYICM